MQVYRLFSDLANTILQGTLKGKRRGGRQYIRVDRDDFASTTTLAAVEERAKWKSDCCKVIRCAQKEIISQTN